MLWRGNQFDKLMLEIHPRGGCNGESNHSQSSVTLRSIPGLVYYLPPGMHSHHTEKKMNQIQIFSIVKNVINFHKGLQVARVTSLRIACKLYMVWESIICLLVCSIHTYGKLDQGHLGMLDP